MPTRLETAAQSIRSYAATKPGAIEAYPWGEVVLKVRGKVFVFLSIPDEDSSRFSMSVKLPKSGTSVLEDHDFAKPTSYGLGKSGWVTAKFEPRDSPPVKLLRSWIDESYRVIAGATADADEKPKPKSKRQSKSTKTSRAKTTPRRSAR